MSELRHRKTGEDTNAAVGGESKDHEVVREKQASLATSADMSDFSKEGVRLLLRRYYDKVNKEKLGDVDRIVDEFESRIAAKSKARNVERDPDVVYSELAGLNARLRQTYGPDLSLVTGRGGKSRDSRLMDPAAAAAGDGGGGGGGQQAVQGQTAGDILAGLAWVLLFGATAALCIYFVLYGEDDGEVQRGGRRQKERWGRKVQDVTVTVDCTLEELMQGKKGTVKLRRQEVCEHCHGTGAHSRHRCPRCNGQGVELVRTMMGMMQAECRQCGGRGWVAKHSCPVCQGQGVKHGEAAVPFAIQAGARDGEKVRLEGEGNQMPQADDGDVVVVVREKKHGVWKREGADLHSTLRLSLKEALLGFERRLQGVDGEEVQLRREGAVTRMGERVRVEGRGMPIPGSGWGAARRGDAVLILQVDLPKRLSQRERELLAAALPA